MKVTKRNREDFDKEILNSCQDWTSLSDLMQGLGAPKVGLGSLRASFARMRRTNRTTRTRSIIITDL